MVHVLTQQRFKGKTDRIKLVISYFGAIVLEREVQPQYPQSSDPALSTVAGTQPSLSSQKGPSPEPTHLQESTFLPSGQNPILDEQVAEIWTVDPIFSAQSPFLPDFSEN
ncbi:hypothetical protein ASPCADRAFT_1528 [Aspergillus carbonarius ITEM 5010]|uniref:Uncharacterized protein n=1 Tax=Aspergillus carbonarius (strain ITEM 5010) TaxID=602072 RepID=A0A1R3RZG7_ASPC5|nr:hypothetical protein ASPCADRAFT_1528 [Aspergillus carbonarius ITEM 5010]